jgi:hypothetical protein
MVEHKNTIEATTKKIKKTKNPSDQNNGRTMEEKRYGRNVREYQRMSKEK